MCEARKSAGRTKPNVSSAKSNSVAGLCVDGFRADGLKACCVMTGDTFAQGVGLAICRTYLIDLINKHVAHHGVFEAVSPRPARLIKS
jgi:hypothetical protein